MEIIAMDLFETHRKVLCEESGISPDVVEARGYRSVTTKADLKTLGFSEVQASVPGLLIPIRGPSGEIVLYQYRPDEPRIRDGKPVKYETPPKTRMALDVPPSAREMLGDPSVPLFITEGAKKADALVSRDLCAIALLGVWNWRGKNEKGGKALLPDWHHVALNDRQVYIVFDSDVMLKPAVYKALVGLKAVLEAR